MKMIENLLPMILVIFAIIVPVGIVVLPYKIKYDEDGKIMFILSIIYNFILGILGIPIALLICGFNMIFFENASGEYIYLFYVTFSTSMILGIYLLFIKINIFMKKKIKINSIVYIILTIIIFGLGIMVSIIFSEYIMLTKVVFSMIIIELFLVVLIYSPCYLEENKK